MTYPSRPLLLTAALVALAACQPAGQLEPLSQGAYAPGPATRASTDQSVDGLLVGHRLMASGEYELALKAYYRAAGAQGMTTDVLSALGSANLRLGRLQQSEALLRDATEKDAEFVPAWNNLGVVLMELGETGEAMRVFRVAFALDGANTPMIRDNLRLALAKMENPAYTPVDNHNFDLVRRGPGAFQLLSTP